MKSNQLLQFETTKDEFAEHVFLVTGAGSGVGRAVALAAAKAGATIVLVGEQVKQLESVYDEIEAAGGPQAAIHPMNFSGTSANDFSDLANTLATELGGLDAVISNAAWMSGFRPFTQLTVDEYQKTMNINLHAPYWLAHACLPLLQKSKNASLLFSDHSSSTAYFAAFGAAKAATRGLVEILAHEYAQAPDAKDSAPRAVRVNSIDPGPLNTQMRRTHYPGENWDNLPLADSVAA